MKVSSLQTYKIRAKISPTAENFAPRAFIMLNYSGNILQFCELIKETTHKQEYWKHCGLTVDWALTQCSLCLVDVAWQ